MPAYTTVFAEPELQPLTDAWTVRVPGCAPVGSLLRGALADRWVRFHSLPGSKRYAETADEAAEVARRHQVLLDDLGAAGRAVVVSARYGPEDLHQVDEALQPEARRWLSLLGDEEEGYWTGALDLVVSFEPFGSAALQELLRAVADDEISEVLLAPADFEWIYHPYDGGADLFATTSAQRDALRAKHHDWLSDHPLGL